MRIAWNQIKTGTGIEIVCARLLDAWTACKLTQVTYDCYESVEFTWELGPCNENKLFLQLVWMKLIFLIYASSFHSWNNQFQLRLIIFKLIAPLNTSWIAKLHNSFADMGFDFPLGARSLENHAWNDSDEGEIKVIDFQGHDKESEWKWSAERKLKLYGFPSLITERLETTNNMINLTLNQFSDHFKWKVVGFSFAFHTLLSVSKR